MGVARRAKENGVLKIIVPGSDLATSKRAIEVCRIINGELGKFCFVAVGIHPVHVDRADEFGEIKKLAELPEVVAIGECGLDFYHDKEKRTKEEQIELFTSHIKLAVKLDKPLIIHDRDADEEILAVIGNHTELKKAVVHCFLSDWEVAQKILERGFLISLTGAVTYSDKMDEVIIKTPLEKLMLETDSPYLVPEPIRSQGVKRSEPQHALEVAKKIAEVKNIDLNEVLKTTTQTAREFFKI